jgi:hypothetical protein
MAGPAENYELAGESSQMRTPNQLIHLIRKLRWMGLDDEAARMEARLGDVQSQESVLKGPVETD